MKLRVYTHPDTAPTWVLSNVQRAVWDEESGWVKILADWGTARIQMSVIAYLEEIHEEADIQD